MSIYLSPQIKWAPWVVGESFPPPCSASTPTLVPAHLPCAPPKNSPPPCAGEGALPMGCHTGSEFKLEKKKELLGWEKGRENFPYWSLLHPIFSDFSPHPNNCQTKLKKQPNPQKKQKKIPKSPKSSTRIVEERDPKIKRNNRKQRC